MKVFRDAPAAPGQMFLLPMCVDEFVGPLDPARILSRVVDELDLTPLRTAYTGGGRPAYDPSILLKVLLFGYSEGIRSSRKLDKALGYDLRFMFLAQMSRPDFHTLARFRRQHAEAIAALFVQTVGLAQKRGLVLLEHVAVDGTKIEADVSGKRTFRKARLQKRIEQLDAQIEVIQEQVQRVMEEAEAADQREIGPEDAGASETSGSETSGSDAAAGGLEALWSIAQQQEPLLRAHEAMQAANRETVAVTDLDSRLMRTHGCNRPAYNAQAAVDEAHQIIVAADVTQDESDNLQLAPIVEATQANTGTIPQHVLADGGYWSEQSLAFIESVQVDAYLGESGGAPPIRMGWEYSQTEDLFRGPAGDVCSFWKERLKRGATYRLYRSQRTHKGIWVRQDAERTTRMREKMRTPEARKRYRLRQQIVEPVFGHMKTVCGLRRFLLRGLAGARVEYLLACTAHNLAKVGRAATFQAKHAQKAAIQAILLVKRRLLRDKPATRREMAYHTIVAVQAATI